MSRFIGLGPTPGLIRGPSRPVMMRHGDPTSHVQEIGERLVRAKFRGVGERGVCGPPYKRACMAALYARSRSSPRLPQG
ncbi:hypothetical protein BC938DRAFT_472230 [Jimgerdemannia flammicorona]|uniref:Uncharacterized protein n=1 Tax=Jimgerdemannia flammicorona TaxID=994334 RepID=A0A433Q6K1_9FUNG|nr:hypothetical protein BC938DRAFT_472230 [Jimgerdemannia flammicorona]